MIYQALFTGLGTLAVFGSAYGNFIDYDKYVQNITLSENTTLAAGNTIDAEQIHINRSLYLTNNGTIYGDIYICEYCEVYIQNSGTYTGTIHADNGASVTRVISSREDLSELTINGDVNILVKNAVDITMTDILNLHDNVAKITIENSNLVLNTPIPDTPDTGVKLIGNVTLQPDDGTDVESGALVPNVSGDGTLILDTPTDDSLYNNELNIDNNTVYVTPVRETDSSKLFDDKRSDFLNDIRASDPKDKLISALDSAKTMPEINRIISKSIRLNPKLLMRPIRTFDRFARMDSLAPKHNFAILPEYVSSNHFYIGSVNANAGINLSEKLYIGITGYTGRMDYSDFINDYSGALYGTNATLSYNGDRFMMRAITGATTAKFDTPTIFYNNKIHKNPTGHSVYGNAESGIPFNISTGMRITPFIGFSTEYTNIINIHHHDFAMHGGTDIVYSINPEDIRYDYKIHIATGTDGIMRANIGAYMFSTYDNIGGGFNIGLIKDDIATSYKAGLDLHMRF